MNGPGLKYNLLFGSLEAAYWAAYSALYAFIIPILSSYGYSSAMSGLVTTLTAVSSVVAQPLLGYVIDTYIPSKRLLIGAMSLGVVLTAFLPGMMLLSPAIAIPYIVLLSFVDYSLYSAIDVWAIRSVPKYRGMDFAFVRAGGSIGYATLALIMGMVVARTGTQVLFWVHGGMLVVAILLCFFLEEVPCDNRRVKAGRAETPGQQSLSILQVSVALIKNRKYVVFILSMLLFQYSFRLTGTYLPLLVENAGGHSGHLGLAIFIGSGLEAVAMMFMSRLLIAGISIPSLVIFSFACGVARMLTLYLDFGVSFFIFLQIFQALAMGAYLRAFVQYISEITPRNITASATTIGMAFSSGLGSMIGNFSMGLVIQYWGIHTQIALSALMLTAGFLVFMPTFLEELKKRRPPVLRWPGSRQ